MCMKISFCFFLENQYEIVKFFVNMEVKGDIALVSLIDSFEFRIKSLYPHSFSLPEVNWVSVVDLLKDGVAHMR